MDTFPISFLCGKKKHPHFAIMIVSLPIPKLKRTEKVVGFHAHKQQKIQKSPLMIFLDKAGPPEL